MIECPQCGTENPEHARFCLSCGTPLSQPVERRKERKFATALFADLVGSTTLAEHEDPEVVQSVVGRAFDRLAEEVQRYEGLLEKFMGDAVLAVFGVPKAHEDDAERAVRAALEMAAVLSELNRVFAAEGKPELAMRIGVEAGEVLVDLERASGPRDRMLTGDAVNTAARLQTAAEPGHVVVGSSVYAATKDVIDYTELEPLTLKGKAEPVPAWDALRVKAKRRGERPSLGLEAKLIGRDEELSVLKQTLRRVESEGRPALVTVIGPAGVGKSRLVAELLKHVEGLPQFIYWRNGRCLAYGNTSYSALADAVKAQCEILEDDSIDVAAQKADLVVHELFGDDAVAPHVRALVGAGSTRSFNREELFEAWRRFLERLAARYPLVLVLEDIHWADGGLLDFIDHVADWAQGPIMLLSLARPELFETRPSWGGGKRNAASIYLDPLSPDEGASMLDDLLKGNVAPKLRDMIVDRSEGNPLYVEEIVRKLIDDGVLRATQASKWEVASAVEDVELPRSVQGLIAARIDGLPDEEKTVLQDAAVVGRVFWSGAVAELSGGDPAAVRDALGRLRVKEIVVPHDPSSFSGEAEFSFRHLLLRDGAYDSLPKSLRAEKHVGVARWAQGRAGDRAAELAELIATHYREAVRYLDELGEKDQRDVRRNAYRWATAAGDRALSVRQVGEAVTWYGVARSLAKSADAPQRERAELAAKHVDASWGVGSTEIVAEAAREALELFSALDDAAGMGRAESRLGFALFQQAEDDEASRYLRSAVDRLEPLGESADLADALHLQGWYHWRRGRNEIAEPLLRRSIELALRLDAALVHAQATQTLGVMLSQSGRHQEGLEVTEEAFRLAKEVGDFANLLRCYNNLAALVNDTGSDSERAEAILREGLEFALKAGSSGNAAWLTGGLGDVMYVVGRLEDSERYNHEAAELARAVEDKPLLGMRLIAIASIELLRGRTDDAEATFREADRILAENPEPQSEVLVHDVRARLALARGDDEEAIEHYSLGVELLRRYSVEFLPEIVASVVRTVLRHGDRDRAESFRNDLATADSVDAKAFQILVDGLLEADPLRSVELIRSATERFEELGRPLELARALIDLARAQQRAGENPRPTLDHARDLLVGCDAVLFLPEVDELRTSLDG